MQGARGVGAKPSGPSCPSLMPASPFSAHSVPLQVVREAAYVTTSKDVGKWQQVVLQNRRAEQLVFPLRQDIATVTPLERTTSVWKVVTGWGVKRLGWPLGVSWSRSVSPGCAGGSGGSGAGTGQVATELGKVRRSVCVPHTEQE